MRIVISPIEIKPGDIYQGRRIVYVARQGETVCVDFEDGGRPPYNDIGSKPFNFSGQIEVDRKIETVNIEKG